MPIRTTIYRLFLVIQVMFIALSAGLIYWQVAMAGLARAPVHNSRSCLPNSHPVHERIFDRNGKLLVESVLDSHNRTNDREHVPRYF